MKLDTIYIDRKRKDENMKERENFGSRLGFILVSAGCAIGLGNVWKFPYICAENGGGAFLVIYLAFLVLLGLPVLICEFAVGRGSQKSIAKAYDTLEPEGTKWHLFKWSGMMGNYLLMMFYTMVTGWMMYYAYQSAMGQLQGLDKVGIEKNFDVMLANPGAMTLWMVIAVVISLGVGLLGLQNGVEKITKIMMLVLLALMVVLAINSLMLDGAMDGLKYYLYPDFSKIGDRGLGTVVFDALTHAFFTLSLGMGSMEIFGSYLKKDRTLFGESVSIVCVDTLVALTAGLIIIPACFAFGVKMDAGPSLLFITLNNVFNVMEGGRIWGTIFFIFMSFAALSTVIAVCENINSFYMDMFGWSRKKAIALNAVLIIVLSMPAVLGYNVWSGIQPLGEGSTIMDLEDFLVSYNILPLGGLIFVLFCVRKNGWGFENFQAEANIGIGKKVPNWIRGYMSYVLPLIIVVVYLKGYYDTFAKMGTATLIGWMAFAVLLLLFIFGVAFYQKKDKKVTQSQPE